MSCAPGTSAYVVAGNLAKDANPHHTAVSQDPVAIVGGSAAGFFTAALLARAKRRVRVFERAERLDPANRTLIVTDRVRKLLGPVAQGCVVNEIKRFELFTDGRSATIPLHRPDLIIERSKLIHGLAAEAESHGARIELGCKFVSVQAREHNLELELNRAGAAGTERVVASAVVGADGAQSRVAQACGWGRQATAPLIQALVKLPAGMAADTVRVWFIPEDTPYFYWLIPESPERGVLGLIGEDGQETRRCLEQFLDKRHFTPLAFQGARIPIYEGWVRVERKLGQGRIYLVGDAAGQVKVSTVGGVVTGFRGALGVSQAILNGGRSSELRSLRRELDLHLLIRRSMHRFQQADYSRLVDWMNDAMMHSLGSVSRDEAARVLWHICRSQPRLLLVGLRGLLTRGSLSRQQR